MLVQLQILLQAAGSVWLIQLKVLVQDPGSNMLIQIQILFQDTGTDMSIQLQGLLRGPGSDMLVVVKALSMVRWSLALSAALRRSMGSARCAPLVKSIPHRPSDGRYKRVGGGKKENQLFIFV